MSRHQAIRNLDLEDELDDFDGGEDYGYEDGADGNGELGAEDKEKLREGTIEVRQALGPEIAVTDKEIEDSLWYYYYDVAKVVTWLLNQRTASPRKEPKKHKAEGKANGTSDGSTIRSHLFRHETIVSTSCAVSISAADFFRDTPWLHVPRDRLSDILIEPLYPRGRLLGGSSSVGGSSGKVSKLAALAAARKRKEEEKKASSTEPTSRDRPTGPPSSSIALLDKLGSGRKHQASLGVKHQPTADEDGAGKVSSSTLRIPALHSSKLSQHARDRFGQESKVQGCERSNSDSDGFGEIPDVSFKASPSIFARTMLGKHPDRYLSGLTPERSPDFQLPYVAGSHFTESFTFAEPSPDDVLTNAQNSKGSKGGKSASKQPNGTKEATQGANGVGTLLVEESPSAKSKNLDVLAEYEKAKGKNAANFVVIGHVDAGKSTLMGRLLCDLNVVDQRIIDKFRREAEKVGKSSFAFAWMLDQTTEERSRGVTMDIATNNFETSTTKFTILDAPGHQDFIPNMIAGASQADFAVLVIDASIGSFESGLRGQTKEHALLVRSMGVQRLIVAINKLDAVNWSHDRFQEIQQQTSAFLTAAGFQNRNISFIPCSGLTGDNIARPVRDGLVPWYKGPTLVEQLETNEPTSRAVEKPLRLTIGDIFRGGIQHPLSISGRLDQGSLQVGDQVVTIPSGEKAHIKGIEVDHETREWAVAGQNVVLHLEGIDPVHLKTGDVLCPPSSPLTPLTNFTLKILAFDHITPMHVELHRGRLHAAGRITQLVAILNKSSGEVEKKKPRLVKPGNVARVNVEMEGKVALEVGGRVVLRSGGESVCAGLVE
ncbi:MAG: Hsp70 suppressor, GTPase facilitates ribosomal subunit dissociation [Candelina mexicana]|nr:MAG: Hsp70 suppressor, GTPase facilitates ribosomal subunit dissociation [Candelina mexicana]